MSWMPSRAAAPMPAPPGSPARSQERAQVGAAAITAAPAPVAPQRQGGIRSEAVMPPTGAGYWSASCVSFMVDLRTPHAGSDPVGSQSSGLKNCSKSTVNRRCTKGSGDGGDLEALMEDTVSAINPQSTGRRKLF